MKAFVEKVCYHDCRFSSQICSVVSPILFFTFFVHISFDLSFFFTLFIYFRTSIFAVALF